MQSRIEILAFVIFSAVSILIGIAAGGSLKVTVFYESLCLDSRTFISEQLAPTYKLIGNDLLIDLVPYGFERRTKNPDGSYSFLCQHGPRECYGNKGQGCAITLYPVEESTFFVYCLMRSSSPASMGFMQQCASIIGIKWDPINKCLTNGQAEKILYQMGERTEALNLTSVPAVAFNGVYNETLQKETLTDFLGVVCKFLEFEPLPCHGINQLPPEKQIKLKLI